MCKRPFEQFCIDMFSLHLTTYVGVELLGQMVVCLPSREGVRVFLKMASLHITRNRT